jgi:hypothetical protein
MAERKDVDARDIGGPVATPFFERLCAGMTTARAFPGRGAACNAAPQIRDRAKLRVCEDPGSAAQHFMPRCTWDTRSRYDVLEL